MRPFFSIWIKPKETFKYLAEKEIDDTKINIDYLFAFIALSIALPSLVDISKLVENFRIFGYIFFTFAIGAIGVIIFKFVHSFIIFGISKLLQGKASIYEIRLVLAYSLIPNLIHLIIGLILIIPAIMTENFNLVFYRHPLTLFVVWIFTVRNLIFGLSYFNKFSYGYAVLNLVIPTAIVEAIYLLTKYLI
ncbi:MAG: YIP1 family protein [Bacteroidales bacterium]|nr:YIP1 family protein [Bacteroidales bacterium]